MQGASDGACGRISSRIPQPLDEIILFIALPAPTWTRCGHPDRSSRQLLADRKMDHLDDKARHWLGNALRSGLWRAAVKRVIQRRCRPAGPDDLEGKIGEERQVKVGASKTGLTIDVRNHATATS